MLSKLFKLLPGRIFLWVIFILLLSLSVAVIVNTQHNNVLAAIPCDNPANPIVEENCKAGNPQSEWDITGYDATIQGYATDISVNKGEKVNFKVKTDSTDYRIDIYRLGYYGGLGARKITTLQPSVSLPQTQPECLSDTVTGLIDCGNWTVSASWNMPATTVSGVYIGKLVREDITSIGSHIIFIVRDDSGGSDILFQTSDTTWQAYNRYGGNSLYRGLPVGRAYKVSYNRPFVTRYNEWGSIFSSQLFDSEYPTIRFLEANGYDVSYFTGVDSDRRGAEILEHKLFLSVGHDEYWSKGQRTHVENARNNGVNLAFFSGNEVFWRTRWETSIDGSGTTYRTLVCYKETKANAKIDPSTESTSTWRDPRFSPDGAYPENALTGTIYTVIINTVNSIKVPYEMSKLRMWRNTSIANLAPGESATITPAVLTYEWDEVLHNGYAPAGIIKLSSITADVESRLQDYGNTYAPAKATHNLSLYKHSSGAWVFGAGAVHFGHTLDSVHDVSTGPADKRMQQAVVNIFADMQVQPTTLQSGLVAATADHSDTTAPTSTIVQPSNNSTLLRGAAITVSGTARDSGGGVIGGVEVSFDGGTTWNYATGHENWTFEWSPDKSGQYLIKTRAVDDRGNIETPGSGITVTVETPAAVTLSGMVFVDRNRNGLKEAAEEGLADIVVTVTEGGTSQTTTTDVQGKYEFLLPPDKNYTVSYQLPPGFRITTPSSKTIFLGNNTTQNFGASLIEYSISGVAFEDKNGNGVFDSGDNKLKGRDVYLKNTQDGSILKKMITDTGGFYYFYDLTSADYRVSHDVPSGYIRTTDDSTQYTMSPSNGHVIHNFGIKRLIQNSDGGPGFTISGYVFVDTNRNGVVDANESKWNGREVVLANREGTAILMKVITDGDGRYTFENILAGDDYRVAHQLPQNYERTTDDSVPLSLHSNMSHNFGFVPIPTFTVSGIVFEDTNRNGQLDAAEKKLESREVKLMNRAGTTTFQTVATDGSGSYSFSGLIAGSDYRVYHQIPSGYERTTDDSVPLDLISNTIHYFGIVLQ
jgi:hypothetical protein